MRSASWLTRAALIGCLLLALAGCGGTTAESGEETGPGSESGSGSGGWLDGIPATVPEFTYGEFDRDQTSSLEAGPQTMYSLYYEGVTQEEAEAYVADLESAGFSMTREDVSEGLSAFGQLKAGDVIVVGVSISLQEGGHVDLTVSVTGAGQ